jgi:hypothetical protein
MTNREWLNSLSDEALADLLEEPNCVCCVCYGKCCGESCRDGLIEWLKKEHEDGEEADYKCSEVCRDGERGQKQLPKPE